MSKKIIVTLVISILLILGWSMLGGNNTKRDSLKEEMYQSGQYEYEVDSVSTVVTFIIKDKLYSSNIEVSNAEILYLAQQSFNNPKKYDLSYQMYEKGKHIYAGNIKYTGEIQNEGMKTSDIENDGESGYQTDTQNVQEKSSDGEGADESRQEIKENGDLILSIVEGAFEAIQKLNEHKLITVKKEYFIKEIKLNDENKIKEIEIANKQQKLGNKTIIRITVEE